MTRPACSPGPPSRAPTWSSWWPATTGAGSSPPWNRPHFPDSFERIFGTPHGARLSALAAAAGLPYRSLRDPAELPAALSGSGLRIVEVPAGRAEGAALRHRLHEAAVAAIRGLG